MLTDDVVLDFIRLQADSVQYITSVCTGALVLGAAGLLKGKKATTHWNAMDFLEVVGAIPTSARVVRDGKVITAGGVTSGIDFGLTILEEVFGRQEAETVQLTLEYAPAPPFNAGTPDQADALVLENGRKRLAASRAAREAIFADWPR